MNWKKIDDHHAQSSCGNFRITWAPLRQSGRDTGRHAFIAYHKRKDDKGDYIWFMIAATDSREDAEAECERQR